jgi:RNA polymerase sigma-70 factor, ECF subfamily
MSSFPFLDEDERVIIAAAKGDPQKFTYLYDRYVQPVYRYIFSRVGNKSEAEDLTSQTFLAALEAVPRYQERGFFSAWLFSIARRKVMDALRKKGYQVSLDLAEQVSDGLDAASQVYRNTEIEELISLIHSLDEPEQELIRLRYVAELSFAEMADLVGKSEEAVKKSLYRLLTRLQDQMEK